MEQYKRHRTKAASKDQIKRAENDWPANGVQYHGQGPQNSKHSTRINFLVSKQGNGHLHKNMPTYSCIPTHVLVRLAIALFTSQKINSGVVLPVLRTPSVLGHSIFLWRYLKTTARLHLPLDTLKNTFDSTKGPCKKKLWYLEPGHWAGQRGQALRAQKTLPDVFCDVTYLKWCVSGWGSPHVA
jgi:hypothetical protein